MGALAEEFDGYIAELLDAQARAAMPWTPWQLRAANRWTGTAIRTAASWPHAATLTATSANCTSTRAGPLQIRRSRINPPTTWARQRRPGPP
jgi:hypothetical protein